MEKKLKSLRFENSTHLTKYTEENRISREDIVTILKDANYYILFFYR